MVEDSPRTIERAYRVRCYPTKAQARTLAQLFGAKRFVWNWAVADARRDLLHKATTDLVARHALIGIENLSVKGMQRGLPRIRRSVGNACLGEVRRQLKYKSNWAGRELILVDRFFPSSQLCSACGWRNTALKLSQRSWQCAECGAHHDRDHNAAKNILAEAQRIAAAQAGYPEEPGKLRAGSAADSVEASSLQTGPGTSNRELNVSPTRARRRQARRDRAKATAA
jgi:putative transposase